MFRIAVKFIIVISTCIIVMLSCRTESRDTAGSKSELKIFKTVVEYYHRQAKNKMLVDPIPFAPPTTDSILVENDSQFRSKKAKIKESKARKDIIKKMGIRLGDIDTYEKCIFPDHTIATDAKDNYLRTMSKTCRSLINSFILQLTYSKSTKKVPEQNTVVVLKITNHSSGVYQVTLEKKKKWQVIKEKTISSLSS